MSDSKNNLDYQVNSELEPIASKLVPLSFRTNLFEQEPDSTATRLSVIIKYIHKNQPGTTITPKIAAYMVGMDPRYPRGIHPMIASIKNKEENFPAEVVSFKQGKKKYDSSKSDRLLNALMEGTISNEELQSIE